MAKDTSDTAGMTPEEKFLHTMRENFKRAEDYWSDDRKQALDDIRFRAGEQWPSDVARKRNLEQRPCLVVDKLNQYVRQVVNDGRQNRPSIKVRPVDTSADPRVAEVFQGLIRHIEYSSRADAVYDSALDNAAGNAFGYFRIVQEFETAVSFDQVLRIKRIRNPLSVLIDPDTVEPDASDIRFAFVIDEMLKKDFQDKYPDKQPVSWETTAGMYQDWYGEKVRVVEYYWVEEVKKKLYLTQDNRVLTEQDVEDMTKRGEPVPPIIRSRVTDVPTVFWCKASAAAVLEEKREIPSRWIPLFVVWGEELDIEGKVIHRSLLRPGKDPQRLYNYSRSAFAERVALTPKAPWVAAEGQVEDYLDKWNTANTANHSTLIYKPTTHGGQLLPPPQRVNASDVPQGFVEDMKLSEHDIQAAMGMYNSSIGAPSNERSGKAILARQKEGDVSTFHFHDNQTRAISHCGRVLVDMIPKVYDSTRQIRILGEDQKEQIVSLNPASDRATSLADGQMTYNLGIGTYDVVVDTGPNYSTLRQEAATAMMELVQANPELIKILGDLMARNMDWPGAQAVADRLRFLLPREIQEAEATAKQENIPLSVAQKLSTMQGLIQHKDDLLQRATMMLEGMQGELERLKREAEAREDLEDVKRYDAQTKRLVAIKDLISPEQVRDIVLHTLLEVVASAPTVIEPEGDMEFGAQVPGGMPPEGFEAGLTSVPVQTEGFPGDTNA